MKILYVIINDMYITIDIYNTRTRKHAKLDTFSSARTVTEFAIHALKNHIVDSVTVKTQTIEEVSEEISKLLSDLSNV